MPRTPRFTFERRSCGLLLHPTSLPGRHGCGDIGAPARAFADFLAAARQTWWQMLPIGPPGKPPGNSPYSSYSSFAGSPLLIDLDELARQGLLARHDVEPKPSRRSDRVDYRAAAKYRESRLRKAFAAFDSLRDARHADFGAYCAEVESWLDDFALFSALKVRYRGAPWPRWDRDMRLRTPAAIARVRRELAAEIRFHKFVQFTFDRQWAALRRYCNDRGIGLIGDIPIFVAHDSADVWAHQKLFLLDSSSEPRFVSGYPPDVFNKNGQRWNHPQYDWSTNRADDYAWWVARFATALQRFDAVRIDHFLGFERLWHIPASARTAARGTWAPTPGTAIFRALRKALGDVPIIAEDLGLLTPAAARLRDRFGFPGMRIMQFGFGGGESSYHLPHRYVRRCVAYTGTHDNETIVGWFNRVKKESPAEYRRAVEYLNIDGQPHEALIRAAMMSVADTVIFPMQDVLGLDASHRMNTPGTARGNWTWRVPPGALTPGVARRLGAMVEVYDRTPATAPSSPPPRSPPA